jgi:hypothetical protein
MTVLDNWWVTTEGKVWDAMTHEYFFLTDQWSPRRPNRGEFVYFIQRKGTLFYIGITRNPRARMTRDHEAYIRLCTSYRVPDFTARCVPMKNIRQVIGIDIPTLEVAESVLIDCAKECEQNGGRGTVVLINRLLSDKVFINQRRRTVAHEGPGPHVSIRQEAS